MTVWQYIPTARRGVIQGFPLQEPCKHKNTACRFFSACRLHLLFFYFFFFPKYASLISSFSSSSLPLPSILMRPVSST